MTPRGSRKAPLRIADGRLPHASSTPSEGRFTLANAVLQPPWWGSYNPYRLSPVVLEAQREQPRLRESVRRVVAAPSVKPQIIVSAFAALTLLVTLAAISLTPTMSHAVFIPLVVAAAFLLSGRRLALTIGVILVGYLTTAVVTWSDAPTHWSVAVALALIVGIVAFANRRRLTMGVPLSVGSSMLKDLRQRLDTQALPPEMPEGMRVEHCVLPSRGDAFSGDFVVAARRDDRLHLALTDVSGHGPSAGMRALLLSGALAGLLGETRPEDFLPGANRYLIRQGWRDGFASAIHVSIDVENGEYCVGTAGHPSAAHYHAATGQWEMITGAAGLLLGLFEQGPEDYARAGGTLEPGDVLLLYTDGVVEGADGDLAAGTQQMLRLARKAFSDGLDGCAKRICEASARAGGEDDRSVVVIWRPVPASCESRETRGSVSA